MLDTHPGADILDIRALAEWLDDLELTENPTPDDIFEIDALHKLQAQFAHSLYVQGNDYEPTMILDDYFVTYAQEYADDSAEFGKTVNWPYNHIDWEAAAEQLQADFTSVEYGGYTYWIR
jgi:hypothetical protein